MQISETTRQMAREAEIALRDIFDDIDEIKKNCDIFIEDYTSLIDE